MMPELTRVFDEQRAEQQQLIRVALIQKEVNTTRDNALKWFDQLSGRGDDLQRLQKQGDELEESSRMFLKSTQKKRCCRCIPRWWYEKTEERRVVRRGM
jgi:hypothetical protein